MDVSDRENSQAVRAIPNIISFLSIFAGIGLIWSGVIAGNLGVAFCFTIVAVAAKALDGPLAYYLDAKNVLGWAEPLESTSGLLLGVGVVGTLTRVGVWSFWFPALPLILAAVFLQVVSLWPHKFPPIYKRTQNWLHPLMTNAAIFWGIVTMIRQGTSGAPDFHDLLIVVVSLIAMVILDGRYQRKLPLFGMPSEKEHPEEPDDYLDTDVDDEDRED